MPSVPTTTSPPSYDIQQSSAASVVVIDETVDHGVASEGINQISATHWDEQFEELLSFKAQYGHCNFPQNTTEELTKKYPTLAKFCLDQRLEYRRFYDSSSSNRDKVMMSLQRFDRTVRWRQLEEIGFEFNAQIAQWYNKYHELLQYYNANGHVRVKPKENRRLYDWVSAQRARRKGAKGQTKLSDTQIKLLDDIGFEWELELYDAKWMEKYNELLQYRTDNGHVRVKEKENAPLYSWILAQRFKRKGTITGYAKLSDTQIKLLDDIGFEWESVLTDVLWMEKYNELVDFKNKHGHLLVAYNAGTIYQWMHEQRQRREGRNRRSPLSEEQIKLLDDIEFPWKADRYDSQWYNKYHELEWFQQNHGHCAPRKSTHVRLSWSLAQRNKRKTGVLSTEQIQLLDKIEFPWELHKRAKWLVMYDELVEYCNQHGHIRVSEEDDSELYEWMILQRKRYHGIVKTRTAMTNELERFQQNHGHCAPRKKTHTRLYSWSLAQRSKRDKGILSAEQIQLLDKIDFPWEVNRGAKWLVIYDELVEYCNQHGHLRVSEEDDSKLYEWMALQRKRYHGIVKTRRAMTDNQIEKLEALHFWCWSLDWRERTWHAKYTEVVEFYKEHGHTRVDKKDHPSLYNWIQTQGKRYKELKGHKPLSEEELELLEQIDFPFFEDQPRMSWNNMYTKVERYREDNDGRFPDHKDDSKLNRWMRQQRYRMRNSYGYVALSDDQNELLKAIDFPMLPKGTDLRFWYERYDELVEFRKQHGHFVVGRSENPGLCAWIDRQRSRYKGIWVGSTGMPLLKAEEYVLERIGFPWVSDRNEIEWQQVFEELVQFKKEHGHLKATTLQNPFLVKWIHYQRKKYDGSVPSELSPDQIERLENIGFHWSVKE
eukprot:CAMPEP_0113660858 /NCGR_PEP_ID=MMETSP0017_2-20120614/33127_1 /TAXON_ID=2856 /ORGANISM="Cylindrotheca closterium" /LENGTH=880 /DNA_ID=CAMNT_0000575527 /DNA_START=152 /DNA_END=2795 /DNA_ORIENTATION=+ /assembly_acc=CAM_ASM_000147